MNKERFGRMLGALLAAAALPASADIIYDNSQKDLGRKFDPGTLEVGDEVNLAGTARYLTNLAFEVWGTNTANPLAYAGTVEVRLRLYQNDGTLFNTFAKPQTLLYDSTWLTFSSIDNLGPTERNVIAFNTADFNGGLFLPVDHLTWTVQFRGLGATDSVGLDLYDPPVVGSSPIDYWQNTDGLGGWELMTNSVAMNFAARFEAGYSVVPEPASLGLFLLGGIGFMLARRRDR